MPPPAGPLRIRDGTDIRVGAAARVEPRDLARRHTKDRPGRLAELGATITGALTADGLDHYAMGMQDPEGNEFDIN